jgi:monoamine oxidase
VRYRGDIPRISPAILADVGQAQARLDRMARQVDPEAPWLARRAERWDRQTFATWIARNTVTRGAATLFEIGVQAVWAPSRPTSRSCTCSSTSARPARSTA